MKVLDEFSRKELKGMLRIHKKKKKRKDFKRGCKTRESMLFFFFLDVIFILNSTFPTVS